MGGCRCYFRDCHTNSVKYTRLHFFRFPLKDVERYKKWRQLAKTENMVEFSEMRRKNMNICARHFRAECFMNYKMDRLAPNAIPTLMRLSKDLALDYELDVENGVLITLETPKLKHLIAPDNFECALHLEDDNILIEKLNELQRQEVSTTQVTDELEYVASSHALEYEEEEEQIIIQKPLKNLVNTVQILETIQVKAPNTKRSRDKAEEGIGETTTSGSLNKKCKILNTNNCQEGTRYTTNTTTIVLDNCELANGDIIDFVQSEDMPPNNHELVNEDDDEDNGTHFLLTTDDFNLDAEDDTQQQLVEIHGSTENNFQYDCNDPAATVVQLKETTQFSVTEELSRELELAQNEQAELQKKLEELQTKHFFIERENSELKVTCQENEQLKTKLLSLQKENQHIKKTLNENKTLKEQLQKMSETNRKLKEQCDTVDILKAEIMSRQQETNELKKLLASLKGSPTREQQLIEEFEKNLETERANNLSNELKLKEEISLLKTKLETTQQQLVFTQNELKDVKLELNSKKNDNERLSQRHEQLEQSLNNIQNNFDLKNNDYRTLKSDNDNLQQKYSKLEQKYWKLQALQNQEATVTTSLEKTSSKQPTTPTVPTQPAISAGSLTKAQLFNGIKRYLSASMVSLLRMEMFGSSEREWKTDERQVAVDILRLGETVYKYFTDEWRFRLPGLRDVRQWLTQSQNMMDDEEDL